MDIDLLLNDLRMRDAAGDPIKVFAFWRPSPPAAPLDLGCLSQWYFSDLQLDGHTFPTAEHYMMWSKAEFFGDTATAKAILDAPNPGRAKELGREVRGFDAAAWNAASIGVVERGSHAKFTQNAELGEFLVSTAGAVLAEASPVDRIWGVGLRPEDPRVARPVQWLGRNQLGFVLTTVRDRLLVG